MCIYARIEKIGLLSILLSRKEYGMREKQIEQKLVQESRKSGGICPKFTSPGFAGMPDRLLLLPHGRMAYHHGIGGCEGRAVLWLPCVPVFL